MTNFEKLGQKYFPGSSTKGKSYQDLSFLGVDVPFHRVGTAHRAEHISKHYDVSGKKGLDIGCSVGGISLALVKNHNTAHMVGVDIDFNAVEVANELASKYRLNAVFAEMDITSIDFLTLLDDQEFDFVVWYSNFMWIAKNHGWDKAYELVRIISEKVPVLFFETAQKKSDGVAGDFSLDGVEGVQKMLQEHSTYTDITNLGVPPMQEHWRSRNVFLARR